MIKTKRMPAKLGLSGIMRGGVDNVRTFFLKI